MIKELKYFLYIITIIFFIFFIFNHYFSDSNKKNFYRTINSFNSKLNIYSDSLDTIKNDTDNIIEYVETNIVNDKKKYKFWELLFNNEK